MLPGLRQPLGGANRNVDRREFTRCRRRSARPSSCRCSISQRRSGGFTRRAPLDLADAEHLWTVTPLLLAFAESRHPRSTGYRLRSGSEPVPLDALAPMTRHTATGPEVAVPAIAVDPPRRPRDAPWTRRVTASGSQRLGGADQKVDRDRREIGPAIAGPLGEVVAPIARQRRTSRSR